MPGLADTNVGLWSAVQGLPLPLGGVGTSGGLQGGGAQFPAVAPGTVISTLDIDFVNNRAWSGTSFATIPSLLTCTRASSGYYTTASGTLVNFPNNNTLRYGTNGLLVEGASTNLLLQSNTFATTWTTTNITNLTNTTSGPDAVAGSGTQLNETTTSGNHGVNQSVTKAASALAYVLTVYAQAGVGRTRIALQADDGAGNGALAVFDLAGGNAVIPSGLGTPFTALSSSISTTLNNGWYRCTLAFTTNTATTVVGHLYDDSGAAKAAASISYAGVVGNGVNVYGAQLEQATLASSYIPTTVASATRATDVVTLTSITGLTATGTWLAQFTVPTFNTAASQDVVDYGPVSAGNYQTLEIQQPNIVGAWTASQLASLGTVTAGGVSNGAFNFDAAGNMVAVFNGGPAQTTAASDYTNAAVTSIQLGGRADSTRFLFGYIKRVTFWNSRLSAAIMQQLTAVPVGAGGVQFRFSAVFNAASATSVTINPTTIGCAVGDLMILIMSFNTNSGIAFMNNAAGWTAMCPQGIQGNDVLNGTPGSTISVFYQRFVGSVPGSTTFFGTNFGGGVNVEYGYVVLYGGAGTPSSIYWGDGTMQAAATGTATLPFYGASFGTPLVAFANNPAAGATETSFAFSNTAPGLTGLEHVASINTSANGCVSIATALGFDYPTASITTNVLLQNNYNVAAISLGDPGTAVVNIGTQCSATATNVVNFTGLANANDIIIAVANNDNGVTLSSITNTFGTWTIGRLTSTTGGASNENNYVCAVRLTSAPISTITFTWSGAGHGAAVAWFIVRNCPADLWSIRSAIANAPVTNTAGALGPTTTQTFPASKFIFDFAIAMTFNGGSGETLTYNVPGFSAFAVDGSIENSNGRYSACGWRPLTNAVTANSVASSVIRIRDFVIGWIAI